MVKSFAFFSVSHRINLKSVSILENDREGELKLFHECWCPINTSQTLFLIFLNNMLAK